MDYATINARRKDGRGMLHRVPSGFTLLEILLVFVILAVVTAIAVPKFARAAQVARENSIKDDLRYLRTQIAVYMAQHKGLPPGCQTLLCTYTSDNPFVFCIDSQKLPGDGMS